MNTELQAVRGLKRPWLAALLNLIFSSWGLGYVYLGRWARFLLVVVVSWVLSFALSIRDLVSLVCLLQLMIPIVASIDAWRLAGTHNAALLSRVSTVGVPEKIETPVKAATGLEEVREVPPMSQLWETEIASRLSFYDLITSDMLTHIPKEKRTTALQEYARLHPDEAYWDGQALVRKGKQAGGG